jgi:hypothetical protein
MKNSTHIIKTQKGPPPKTIILIDPVVLLSDIPKMPPDYLEI